MGRLRAGVGLGLALFLAPVVTVQAAVPSPVVHVHTGDTVHWKAPGSPGLPWDHATANSWNHNHLTSDPFTVAGDWVINKAWDNRTLDSSLGPGGSPQFGHGLIEATTPVRYGWGAAVPEAAKTAVEAAFDDWQAAAAVQFDLHDEPWDLLAIDFQRVDAGAKEITVEFQNNLGAYGVFDGSSIKFELNPNITIEPTGGGDRRLSVGNPGVGLGALSLTLATPWDFDGGAASIAYDLWYSDDAGATWADTAPGGFGTLDWNFGTLPSDDLLDVFDMDFRTIALHEVGHAIALGHTGDGSAPIMRDDIALNAHFGLTQGIDADSALAVAIDYTYSIPETSTWMGAGVLVLTCALRVRRATGPRDARCDRRPSH